MIDRMCEALELIATPMRPDGTWNRDREACRDLARKTLDAVYKPRALDVAHTLWAMAQSPAPAAEISQRDGRAWRMMVGDKLPMQLWEARTVLAAAQDGFNVPDAIITEALRVTGDLQSTFGSKK